MQAYIKTVFLLLSALFIAFAYVTLPIHKHTPYLHYSSFLFISDLHLSIFSSISTSQHNTIQQSYQQSTRGGERKPKKQEREREIKVMSVLLKKFSCFYFYLQGSFFALLCFQVLHKHKYNFFILKKQSPFAYRSCSLCLPCRKVIFLPRTFSSFVKTHVFVFCVYFFYIQFLY